MVAYCEVHGWPRGKWDRGEFDGERRLHCYWADVTAVLAELDGNPQWPWQAYNWGAADALIYSADVTGLGVGTAADGSQTAAYQRAVITAKYTTRGERWDAKHGAVVEHVQRAKARTTVDHAKLRWTDGTRVDPNDAPELDIELHEYILTISRLTSVPTWVLTRQGGINSAAFSTVGLGVVFAPRTLLFAGCTISGKYSLGSLPRYDVTAKFLHKSTGWDKHWRPGAAAWQGMKTAGGVDYKQNPEVDMDT